MTSLDALQSPADADNFRMTVDWGRWYVDPLPGCDIAPATEDKWPSYSTVKKAADKDWSFLTVNRLATLEPAELHRIADLDATQRGDAIRSHEKLAKNIAFGRGTIVHLWAEDLANGKSPRVITADWLRINGYPSAAWHEAEPYKHALEDFFQAYQPELVAAEYVTIHRTLNGHGYGCTPDGLFRIGGELVALDWKTRGENSSHAAYPEEAAQIAAGARAEYMIARQGESAERRLIPQISLGYVVSIKPDGARLYPVDVHQAWDHFCNLHAWWVDRLDEKAAIGRVKPIRRASGNTALELHAERLEVDAAHPSPTPTAATGPDEGDTIDDAYFDVLKVLFDGQTDIVKAWFKRLVAEAKTAGFPFQAQQMKTQRRFHIYHALIHLGDKQQTGDGVVIGLLEEVAIDATDITIGHAIGSLNAEQAKTFAQLVDDYPSNK